MTDKEKIRAEIERLKESGCASPIVICDTLLAFIDSMQEKPVSTDILRKASEEYLKVLSETPYNNTPVTNVQTIVKELISYLDNPLKYNPDHVTESVNEDLEKEIDRWSKEQYYNDSEKCAFAVVARHFANWQKQQLIKGTNLYGWVARDENGSLHIFEVEPSRIMHRWWDRDYHSTSLDNKDFPELKWEDEPVYVKLPIIKEE